MLVSLTLALLCTTAPVALPQEPGAPSQEEMQKRLEAFRKISRLPHERGGAQLVGVPFPS